VSWREFVASLVGSLAWPASATFIVWVFREQIAALFAGPVKRWKAGPVEMEYWAQEAAEVFEQVGILDAVAAGQQDDEIAQLAELAEKTPVVAVMAGFRLVERELRKIGQMGGIEGADHIPVSKLLVAAARQGLITQESVAAVRGLMTLRNVVTHDDGSGTSVTSARAQEYVVLVQGVLFALSRAPALVP